MVYFEPYDFLIGVGLLALLLPVIWWRKRNFSYLLFFSLFWLYGLAVVQAVIFHFVINTSDTAAGFAPSINLIPFYFGECFTYLPALCIRGIAENILLTIPCGFGINFLTTLRPRAVFWLALAVGVGFELAQLCISLLFHSGFRAVDINDAMLNAAGFCLGYAAFRAFAWGYISLIEHFRFKPKWLFADIFNIVIQAHPADKAKKA